MVVANHNYGRFLSDAVDSVRNQTYQHWEMIVCDDGSTDDSRAILLELQRCEPRLTVVLQQNGGQASAWNAAVERCSGEIVCLLDADDWFAPEKINTVLNAFRANPDAGVVYHRYALADESGRILSAPPLPYAMSSGWLIETAMSNGGYAFPAKTSDMAIRAEIAAEIFPLPVELEGSGDDYIGRVASFLTEVAAVRETLCNYRIHGRNWSDQARSGAPQESGLRWRIESTERVFPLQQRFLCQRFGREFAIRVRIEDDAHHWKHLRGYYLLTGKPPGGVYGHSRRMLEANLPRSKTRLVWWVLFRIPARWSSAILRLWWSQGPWKKYARPVARALGLREPGPD